ncbi:MAG: hypothetical protein GYA24_04495, partial [Candidatus Lokiarchaeota archaeon]|nr:hypothetical protein [Candidatus Lokiarchaeota archaeon]
MASDPDTSILVDTISRHDMINIYALSRLVRWSYGKTERKVAELVKEGILHARARVEDGRNVKMLSLRPIFDDFASNQPAAINSVPIAIKDAFLQLYGIFKELNAVGLDPSPALLSYGKRQGLTVDAIIALLDTA